MAINVTFYSILNLNIMIQQMRKTGASKFHLLFLSALVFAACNNVNHDSPGDTTTISNDTASIIIKPLLFVGSYSQSFYVFDFDTVAKTLNLVTKSPAIVNPSYLVIHPNRKWVYAVSETNDGSVEAFQIDANVDSLQFLNSLKVHGDSPCFISVDKTGRYVLVANYNSGNVSVLKINTDGSLANQLFTDQHTGKSLVAGRQDGPHAHQILQAANGFVYNTDLGVDKIYVYKLDTASGSLIDTKNYILMEKGAGPRHLAFHPNLKWIYVLGELNGTIEAFNMNNENGSCQLFQTVSSLQAGANLPAASADIHISPDGRFLYASNRAEHNNIAIFAIDQNNGLLELVGHQSTLGKTPRNFTFDPSGNFLLVANQDRNSIIVFRIDHATGKLIDTGIKCVVSSPVCLAFYQL
jgi:6-phosphogluconolactonase